MEMAFTAVVLEELRGSLWTAERVFKVRRGRAVMLKGTSRRRLHGEDRLDDPGRRWDGLRVHTSFRVDLAEDIPLGERVRIAEDVL